MDALGTYSDSNEESEDHSQKSKKMTDRISQTERSRKETVSKHRYRDSRRTGGSHKRRKSRSPISDYDHQHYNDCRGTKSRSPCRRRSRSPRVSWSSRNDSSAKQKHHSEKPAFQRGKTATFKETIASETSPHVQEEKHNSQQTGSTDDKERFEQAIAAAQELASKQPTQVGSLARPMTEQQRVIQQKRKLLWSGKKNKVAQSRNQWESVSFGKDGEDNKFRRLMGIGGAKSSSSTSNTSNEEQGEGSAKDSEKTLTALEQQYEASRYLTHVARGAGLGYGSQALTTELPSQKDSSDKLHETL